MKQKKSVLCKVWGVEWHRCCGKNVHASLAHGHGGSEADDMNYGSITEASTLHKHDLGVRKM